MQMWNTRFVSWFITVQQVVQALTSRGIDITSGYTKWRNLAFALAKEVGVDLSEVFATFAKLPNGKNREKEGKMGVFDDFGDILPNGKMAKVAKSPTDTFSDKLDLDDLPLFLHPIWEHHTDPADLDKMLLGTLNAVSGIIPSSVFGMYDKRVVMVRVTDQVNIEIEEPRLAVFMTCTGNQLVLLLPSSNISNGLASRILFYELARREIHSMIQGGIRAFYQALPDQTFSSGDAMRIAKEQHIADRTANRWLGDLCSKYNLLRRIRNGVYVKLLPKQDDSDQ